MVKEQQDAGPRGCFLIPVFGSIQGVCPAVPGLYLTISFKCHPVSDTNIHPMIYPAWSAGWPASEPTYPCMPSGSGLWLPSWDTHPFKWQRKGPAFAGTQTCRARLSGLRPSFLTSKHHTAFFFILENPLALGKKVLNDVKFN